jgi:hypothetical protein
LAQVASTKRLDLRIQSHALELAAVLAQTPVDSPE